MFNMTTTLILLKDGRNILVSNEIPNEKEFYYKDGEISKRIESIYGRGNDDVEKMISQNNFYSNIKAKKIIAGIESLPTLTYSEKVKQELRDKYGWVDLEELRNRFKETPEWDFYEIVKAHQSITNKMFSLEDLRKAYEDGCKYSSFNDLIQSLQQPIQLKVEIKEEQNSILIAKILS